MQSKWQFALHSGSFIAFKEWKILRQSSQSTCNFLCCILRHTFCKIRNLLWTSHSQCRQSIYVIFRPALCYKCMVNQSLAYIHSRSRQQSWKFLLLRKCFKPPSKAGKKSFCITHSLLFASDPVALQLFTPLNSQQSVSLESQKPQVRSMYIRVGETGITCYRDKHYKDF